MKGHKQLESRESTTSSNAGAHDWRKVWVYHGVISKSCAQRYSFYFNLCVRHSSGMILCTAFPTNFYEDCCAVSKREDWTYQWRRLERCE